MLQQLEQATMFLNDLSVVDHAFIDQEGNIIGGSFNPSFLVSGNIDPVEKVVVDFSTVKKQLKASIDDPDIGFDHKLWFIEGSSAAELLFFHDGITSEIHSEKTFIQLDGSTPIHVRTANAFLIVPRNAIKYIVSDHDQYSIENVGRWFQQYLNEQFPDLNIVCNNTINAHTYYQHVPLHYFSYAHGLKDSTSWGCQNVAHGHLSFIQLLGTDSAQAAKLSEIIAQELDCTMFINKSNITNILAENSVFELDYQSFNRGQFTATFISTPRQKCVVLHTETTIEYLVKYIKTKYFNELINAGVKEIFVSEGLSKGAYEVIPVSGE